jgi:hypothetical protein
MDVQQQAYLAIQCSFLLPREKTSAFGHNMLIALMEYVFQGSNSNIDLPFGIPHLIVFN